MLYVLVINNGLVLCWKKKTHFEFESMSNQSAIMVDTSSSPPLTQYRVFLFISMTCFSQICKFSHFPSLHHFTLNVTSILDNLLISSITHFIIDADDFHFRCHSFHTWSHSLHC